MSQGAIPAEVLERFRTLAQDRLAQMESCWNKLIRGSGEPDAEAEMLRYAHTLKGDARLVSFDEVHLLCNKLEDLLALARQHDYQVSDEIDIVVTMTFQFIGLLVRRKAGAALGGIDLVGFVRQVDDTLRSARRAGAQARTAAAAVSGRIAAVGSDRVSPETRLRLAVAATTAYLEYLNAVEVSRRRLYELWQTLSREVAALEAAPLRPLLERHVEATVELGKELGKRVRVALEVADLRVSAEVAEALDVAVLHSLRNATDHGIESPEARRAAGKPEVGDLRVRAALAGDGVELLIADDGRGIDFDAIRRRAVAAGLLSAREAASAGEAELSALLFRSGFSTRAAATDISGRGVGLDAVRKLIERVRGSVAIRGRREAGTTLEIRVPQASRQIEVYRFVTPRVPLFLAIPACWDVSVCATAPSAIVLDALALLEIQPKKRQTQVSIDGAKSITMRARLGADDYTLLVAEPPQRCTAQRLCPTSDTYPLEVISIGGVEALLLRPNELHQRGRRQRREPAEQPAVLATRP